MIFSHVNVAAIIVAVLINMIVGALWYSPILFGKYWSKLVGKKMEDMQKNATQGYSSSLVVAILQSFVLATVIADIGITSAGKGIAIGALLWVGFVAATTLPDTIFSGRPKQLWLLNTIYYLAVLLINGAILATWH